MDEAKKIMNGVPILEIIPFDKTKMFNHYNWI